MWEKNAQFSEALFCKPSVCTAGNQEYHTSKHHKGTRSGSSVTRNTRNSSRILGKADL